MANENHVIGNDQPPRPQREGRVESVIEHIDQRLIGTDDLDVREALESVRLVALGRKSG